MAGYVQRKSYGDKNLFNPIPNLYNQCFKVGFPCRVINVSFPDCTSSILLMHTPYFVAQLQMSSYDTKR